MTSFLASHTRDLSALLAERLAVVNTMRSDKGVAADFLAVDSILGRHFECLAAELGCERFWEAFLRMVERDGQSMAAWWVVCFIGHGDGKGPLEAVVAEVALAAELEEFLKRLGVVAADATCWFDLDSGHGEWIEWRWWDCEAERGEDVEEGRVCRRRHCFCSSWCFAESLSEW